MSERHDLYIPFVFTMIVSFRSICFIFVISFEGILFPFLQIVIGCSLMNLCYSMSVFDVCNDAYS